MNTLNYTIPAGDEHAKEITISCTVTDKDDAGITDTDDITFWQILITTVVPSHTTEGLNSSDMTVSVSPSAAPVDAIVWRWDVGSSPNGNSPEVTFSYPSEAETRVLEARWFAYPDNEFSAPPSCTYEIYADVTVAGQKYVLTQPYLWTVEVATGVVDGDPALGACIRPNLAGWPATRYRNGSYEVYGLGDLRRVAPSTVVFQPSSSQFYDKVYAHENDHEHHWNNVSPWAGWFDPDEAYNRIAALTASTQQELNDQVQQEVADYITECHDLADRKLDEFERSAYNISNAIEPFYLHNSDYP